MIRSTCCAQHWTMALFQKPRGYSKWRWIDVLGVGTANLSPSMALIADQTIHGNHSQGIIHHTKINDFNSPELPGHQNCPPMFENWGTISHACSAIFHYHAEEQRSQVDTEVYIHFSVKLYFLAQVSFSSVSFFLCSVYHGHTLTLKMINSLHGQVVF